MAKPKNLSRRKFLKTAGLALGGSVIACGGLSYVGLRTPSLVKFPEEECGTKNERILVCYESKSGATAEVAAHIMKKICTIGYSVDLVKAGTLKSIQGYSAAIFGAPVYMGKLMKGIVDAVERFGNETSSIPTAAFALGLTMKEETAETRDEMMAYLQPLTNLLAPVSIGLFGGRIALDTLPPLYRAFSKADADGILAEGDFRDWNRISEWAGEFLDSWR